MIFPEFWISEISFEKVILVLFLCCFVCFLFFGWGSVLKCSKCPEDPTHDISVAQKKKSLSNNVYQSLFQTEMPSWSLGFLHALNHQSFPFFNHAQNGFTGTLKWPKTQELPGMLPLGPLSEALRQGCRPLDLSWRMLCSLCCNFGYLISI